MDRNVPYVLKRGGPVFVKIVMKVVCICVIYFNRRKAINPFPKICLYM